MTEEQFGQELDRLVKQAFESKINAANVAFELQAQGLAIQHSINRFILGDENAETE